MYADFIDGKEVIIWDNRTAPNEKERAVSDSDDGTIFTPYLNCGAIPGCRNGFSLKWSLQESNGRI